MNYKPTKELAKILQPALKPCSSFEEVCKDTARWVPSEGHVPRGFVGALGAMDEVEVILLIAEPGNPYSWESYSPGRNLLTQVTKHTFKQLDTHAEQYSRNLRYVLDLIFPRLALQDQLRRTWITETYLCSAPKEAGSVPAIAEKECANRYLVKQLTLLDGRPVIALGSKAYNRARRVIPNPRNLIKAFAIAPPGCNQSGARPSWENAAKQARKGIQAARRKKGNTA